VQHELKSERSAGGLEGTRDGRHMGASRAARSKAHGAKCTGIEQRSMKVENRAQATRNTKQQQSQDKHHGPQAIGNFTRNGTPQILFLLSFTPRAGRLFPCSSEEICWMKAGKLQSRGEYEI
jgi:hypothetical protein